jgi:deoxyribodipyrimidine photolyase
MYTHSRGQAVQPLLPHLRTEAFRAELAWQEFSRALYDMMEKLKDQDARKLLAEVKEKYSIPDDDDNDDDEEFLEGLTGLAFQEIFMPIRAMGDEGESEAGKST